MKILYAVLGDDPDAKSLAEVETTWMGSPRAITYLGYAAEDCADDYYTDGGRENWLPGESRRFSLFTMGGEPLGVFDVTMDMDPSYRAVLREVECDS